MRTIAAAGICGFLLLTATGAVASQEPQGLATPGNLTAPALGITASTAILLWDFPERRAVGDSNWQAVAPTFVVCRNGTPIGSTSRRSFTAKGLTAGTTYRFSVRVRDAEGHVSESSPDVEITTPPKGETLNVREFGAVGDGKARDTEAIQKAIAACRTGGRVSIPPGTYKVNHLSLKSGMTLEIERGATLSFVPLGDGENYPLLKTVLPGPHGDVPYRTRGLITAENACDLAIVGGGTIDGNGEAWWPHYREIAHRPYTLEFIRGSNLLVQGITIQDPPFWNTHPLYVDRAIFSEVQFLKVSKVAGHNGDGLNPDAARDILIVGCLFANQDDSIAIKAGINSNYRISPISRETLYRSSERITVRDCTFDGTRAPGASPLGIGIGSEVFGGVRHVLVQFCEFIDCASLANIKATRGRPFSRVEDIRFENIAYVNNRHKEKPWNPAALSVNLFYMADKPDLSVAEPVSERTPVFRDLHFENIRIVNRGGRAIYICGLPEMPVRNVTLNRIDARAKVGSFIRNVDGLTRQSVSERPLDDAP